MDCRTGKRTTKPTNKEQGNYTLTFDSELEFKVYKGILPCISKVRGLSFTSKVRIGTGWNLDYHLTASNEQAARILGSLGKLGISKGLQFGEVSESPEYLAYLFIEVKGVQDTNFKRRMLQLLKDNPDILSKRLLLVSNKKDVWATNYKGGIYCKPILVYTKVIQVLRYLTK